MSPDVFSVTRRFSVGEVIELYMIDLTTLGGDIYYFTNNVFEERVPIKFDGVDYVQMPINMTNIDVDSQAAPAQPTLSIATSGGPVASLIASFNDLKRAKVWRYYTFAEFLDIRPDGEGGTEVNPFADGDAIIKQEMYIVNRKTAANDVYAEFELKAPTDQEGVMLPLRIVRKRWCDAKYRVYDADTDTFIYFAPVDGGCPWGNTTPDGGAYFDVNNVETTKANDRCSKAMTGCAARFGQAQVLPYSAFPGIRSTQEAG